MENLAKAGITTNELGEAGNKMGKIFYKITLEAIKQLAKNRNISFEEAESIYFGELKSRKIDVEGNEI